MSTVYAHLLPLKVRKTGGDVVYLGIDPAVGERRLDIDVVNDAGEILGEVKGIDLRLGHWDFLIDLIRPVNPGEEIYIEATSEKVVTQIEILDDRGNGDPVTLWLITGFHYDPVWWNTQSNYLAEGGWMKPERDGAFGLVDGYLDACRKDTDYKFVLEQVPYLKPYWDAHPEEREFIRELIASGRLQVLGGMYDEAQTTLVGPECNARNFLYGCRYMESVYSEKQFAAWQSDVFGHDPNFPQFCARAGLKWMSFARGPFHHFGINPSDQNLPSEFRWFGPDGSMVLAHHMSGHYDWYYKQLKDKDQFQFNASLVAACVNLRHTAATNNICLPLLGDFAPPLYGLVESGCDFNQRYKGIRARVGTFREFTDAVEAEVNARDIYLPPVTRDLNPVLSGCNSTFNDTKLAERAAENRLLTAETLGAILGLFGAKYPAKHLSRAWRQLMFCAHHDAITGSEGGEVYLHLLSSWRSAWYIGNEIIDKGLEELVDKIDAKDIPHGAKKPVIVFNPHPYPVSEPVRVEIDDFIFWSEYHIADDAGNELPSECETVGTRYYVRFIPGQIPPLGWKTYWLKTRKPRGRDSEEVTGNTASIENDRYRIAVDASRGGYLTSVYDKKLNRELIKPGGLGAHVVIREEYPGHMRFPGLGEGPSWLIYTNGEYQTTSHAKAILKIEKSELGRTITAEAWFGTGSRMMKYTLYNTGPDGRLDITCEICSYHGIDENITLDFDFDLEGAKPFREVGNFTVGCSTGWWEDVRENKFPLNFACNRYCGIGAPVMFEVNAGGKSVIRAHAVGEVVYPANPDKNTRDLVDKIVLALYRRGISTSPVPDNIPPYGDRPKDSNIPDFRLLIGGASMNARAKSLVDKGITIESGKISYVETPDDLPLLFLNSDDAHILAELADGFISELDSNKNPRIQSGNLAPDAASHPDWGVALFNRGNVDFIADKDGRLSVTLFRAIEAEPGLRWIRPPERKLADGSICQSQRWSHRYEFSLTSFQGNIHDANLEHTAAAFNRPPVAAAGKKTDGTLPREWSLLAQPASGWELSAFKGPFPPDYMQKTGDTENPRTCVMRLYESRGADVDAKLSFTRDIDGFHECDLIEREMESDLPRNGNEITIPLKPRQMRTVILNLDKSTELIDSEIEPDIDPPPPHLSTYWLHDRHEAPTGNMPQTLIFNTRRVQLSKDGSARIKLTVANSSVDMPYAGDIQLIPPKDFSCIPSEIDVSLDPSGFRTFDIQLQGNAEPGVIRWFWAMMEDANGDKIFDIIPIGIPEHDYFPVELKLDEHTYGLKPLEDRVIELTVKNLTPDLMPMHLEIIGPIETWNWFHSDEFGFYILRPHEKKTIHFVLKLDPDPIPGNHFIFLKAMAGDLSQFSEAIDLWQLERSTAYLTRGPSEVLPGEWLTIGAECISERKPSRGQSNWKLDLPFKGKVKQISNETEGEGVNKTKLKLGIFCDTTPDDAEFNANLEWNVNVAKSALHLPLKFTMGRYVEVRKIPGLKIEADYDNWKDTLTSLGFLGEAHQRGIRGFNPDDLGAEPAIGWTNDGIYIGCAVRDNLHYNTRSGPNLWEGDCLQVAFAKPGVEPMDDIQPDAAEFWFALVNGGPVSFCHFNYMGIPIVDPLGIPVQIPVDIDRRARNTYYKLFIPANTIGMNILEPSQTLRFNIAVNDADGMGWKGAAEWAKGIVLKKDPWLYGAIKLME